MKKNLLLFALLLATHLLQAQCPTPTGLTASPPGQTHVLVTWPLVPGYSNYRLAIGTVAGLYTDTVNATYGSHIIENKYSSTWFNGLGIASNTTYYVKVATKCSNTQTSSFSDPITFTTLSAPCNSPLLSDFWMTNVGTSSFTINCPVGYARKVRIREHGFAWKTAKDFSLGSTSYTWTGLSPCKTYDVQVMTKCTSSSAWSTFSQTKRITTSGTCSALLKIETEPFTAASAANTRSVYIASNGSWNASVNQPWVTLNKTSSTNHDIIGLSFQANTTGQLRSAVLTVTSNGLVRTLVVSQSATGVATCSDQYEPGNNSYFGASVISSGVNYNAQIASISDVDYYRFDVTAQSNVSISLSNLPANFDVKLFNSGLNQIGISEQNGTQSEVINQSLLPGTYYVFVFGYQGAFSNSTCYQVRQTSTVTSSPTLTVSQNSIVTPNSLSGNNVVTVTSNTNWQVTDNATWLTVSPTSGFGNGSFTVNWDANTNVAPRTGEISVTGGGITRIIYVSQVGGSLPNTCNMPIGVAAQATSATSCSVNWQWLSNVINFEVQWRQVNGNWQNITTAATSYSITGLLAQTIYEVRVRANCNSGWTSDWSASQFFTTQAAGGNCTAPSWIQVSNLTMNTCTFNWATATGVTSFQVQQFFNGAWSNIGGLTSSTTMSIYGLVPNATYTWRVLSVCNGIPSLPSVSNTFSTPWAPTCSNVTQQYPPNTLTPSSFWQYQIEIWGGEWSLMNVEANKLYTLSFCSTDGGQVPFDGEIGVYHASTGQLLTYSDDACVSSPKIVSWRPGFNGQVRIQLNKYSCMTQNGNSTLAYIAIPAFTAAGDRDGTQEAQVLIADGEQPNEVDNAAPQAIELKIWPNPASERVTLELPESSVDLQIINGLGVLAYKAQVKDQAQIEVQTSDLPSGMYFVKVRLENGEIETAKIQVLH